MPSPLGEGVCGPARRRMRGCVSAATHKRTVLASLPLISRPRAAASPKGEALGCLPHLRLLLLVVLVLLLVRLVLLC